MAEFDAVMWPYKGISLQTIPNSCQRDSDILPIDAYRYHFYIPLSTLSDILSVHAYWYRLNIRQ